MTSGKFDVLIVGAGLAGSTLALALGGHNLRVGLIEAQSISSLASVLPPPGLEGYDTRVSAITPASQSIFESLGVWATICAKRVSPYKTMQVWDGEGSGEIDFHCSEISAGLLGHIVENGVMNTVLLESIRDRGGVELFSSVKLKSLEQKLDGSVSVKLEDDSKLDTALLVAADGALSRVRELADFRTREWDYGHRALVATVQTENSPQQTARQAFMTQGPLAFLPLSSVGGKHYCSVVWSAEPALSEELCKLGDSEFCERLERVFESRLGKIKGSSPRFAFPLRQRHAIDYVKPGIALVADAAHTIHPLAGQGINIGLQDVNVLADEILTAKARHQCVGALSVLKRYQRRRKHDNLLMMAAMDSFKRLFEQQSLPLRWLRNTGMTGLSKLPALKKKIMRHAMGA